MDLAALRAELLRFDPDVPLESASAIPGIWYTEPAFLELERRAVFAAGWRPVGPAALVAAPGGYLTAMIAGEPVAVVRGDDGVLRGLSNVCRHRAAEILTDTCGRADTLRCPYHGWTYAPDGRLRGAPEFDGVAAFDKAAVRLPEIPVREWGPWVWVNLDGSAGEADLPAGLLEHLAPRGLERLHWVHRATYPVACNWKVYVDNYLDGGYHVPRLHPGLHSVLDYPRYRTETRDVWNVQVGPMKPADTEAAAVRTGETAWYYWLFPDFMINCYSGVMDTNRVEPLGPDRCAVVYDFYFTETAGPAAEKFIADSVRVAEQVQEEDRLVCESVQRGLGSRFYVPGRYSVRRENGGHQFHVLLARRLRGAV